MPRLLTVLALLLAATALAACASTDARRADPHTRWEADLDVWSRLDYRLDSLRYAHPATRVAAEAGLVYQYPACHSYTFDSASGTILRRLVDGSRHDAVRADLTPAQFGAVVAEADRIGLWNYPADFGDAETIAFGPDSSYSVIAMASRHRLDLRAGGRSVIVRWSGAITGPLSERAVALRSLGRLVETFIGADAAYGRFPSLAMAPMCL